MALRQADPAGKAARDMLLALAASLTLHLLALSVSLPVGKPRPTLPTPAEPLVVEFTSPPLPGPAPEGPTRPRAATRSSRTPTRAEARPAHRPVQSASGSTTGTPGSPSSPPDPVVAPTLFLKALRGPAKKPPAPPTQFTGPPAPEEPLIEARIRDNNSPVPDYPEDSRRKKEEGLVYLRLRVNARGKVESVEIERSSGFEALDEAASKAVIRWEFEPAHRGTAQVSSVVTLPVRFRIDDASVHFGPEAETPP